MADKVDNRAFAVNISYIRSIWECKRGAGCVLWTFLCFSDLRYHL